MRTLIDLTFFANKEFANGKAMIDGQSASFGYVNHLKKQMAIEVVKHSRTEEHLLIDDVPYHFFKNNNHFFSFPLKTLLFIHKRRPDVVLVQGLSFPFQVLLLRLFAARTTRIIAQHHGETNNRNRIKIFFQRLADKCIDCYLFNTPAYASERLQVGSISNENKIRLLPEGSNSFTKIDKEKARTHTGIRTRGPVFLWVGRLNTNKDPLTILRAFGKYLSYAPHAQLYMIYQTTDLLSSMNDLMERNALLQNNVHLIGKIPHDELEIWYNAADYFITGSHHEYGGFALQEAMACGCVPIATSIPTMQQYLQHGETGFLFPPENVEALSLILMSLDLYNREEMSQKVAAHFACTYSFAKIAERLFSICNALLAEQLHDVRNRVIDAVSSNA